MLEMPFGLSAGTAMTNSFRAKTTGWEISVLASSPPGRIVSITASLAEANTSAGAPEAICAANCELPANWVRTSMSGLACSKASAISVKASVSDDAANTQSVSRSLLLAQLPRSPRMKKTESIRDVFARLCLRRCFAATSSVADDSVSSRMFIAESSSPKSAAIACCATSRLAEQEISRIWQLNHNISGFHSGDCHYPWLQPQVFHGFSGHQRDYAMGAGLDFHLSHHFVCGYLCDKPCEAVACRKLGLAFGGEVVGSFLAESG